MINLLDYYGKKVIVEDIDGISYNGLVDGYTSAEDNDDGEESIDILTDTKHNEGVELYLSEIKSIRLA